MKETIFYKQRKLNEQKKYSIVNKTVDKECESLLSEQEDENDHKIIEYLEDMEWVLLSEPEILND